jgi:hypothetical protein
VWIGAQAGKQFLLEGAFLLKIVLDGPGVFGEIVGRIVALVESGAVK